MSIVTDARLSITTFAISIISFCLVERVSNKLHFIPDTIWAESSSATLYAACLFIVLHVNASVASWVGTFTVFGLRLLAVRFKMTLPLP